MELWYAWWELAHQLRPAFSRYRTFCWFLLALAGFCVRHDGAGVTAFVRALGLEPGCYERLLAFFHSRAADADRLAGLWFNLVLTRFPVYRRGGRPVLVLDGFKNPKEGRCMPGVKTLHQANGSNSKPAFISGHSFQAFGVLCQACGHFFCVPVCARIHEGVVGSNRDRRTLIDKANAMLAEACGGGRFVLLADAYFANRKVARALGARGCSLVTRVRSNTVAHRPAKAPAGPRPGRPRKYGAPLRLWRLFSRGSFSAMPSPAYGERGVTLRYRCTDLLWKPAGGLVRFVLVIHPVRGRVILMSTDLTLDARDVVALYALRFKIEVAFKAAVYSVGSFGYHFWMANMRPPGKPGGNLHLHRASKEYREAVARKLRAYHLFVQTGFVAQGLLQHLAMYRPAAVWDNFGSWIRTVRPGVLPSEATVSTALHNSLPGFLHAGGKAAAFIKFVTDRIDLTRPEGSRLAA